MMSFAPRARSMLLQTLMPGLLIALAVVVGPLAGAQAQTYPARPVTFVVPFTPGGGTEFLARLLGQRLEQRLGKPFVIENRPGGGGVTGAVSVARAAPDGYTLLMAPAPVMAINVSLHKKLPYDPAADFVPLALVVSSPYVLVVTPSLPVQSVSDLIALAKDKPGRLAFASAGPGTPHHLFPELFKSMTGIEMTHVPYKGSAPALTDVIAGHVPILFSDTVPSLPQIREGKVRALGVSTAVRLPSAPEIPPIAEVGVPGFDAAGWGVFSVPAGTPKEVVAKLKAALDAAIALPEVQQQIIKLGLIPGGASSPEELQRFISSEIARWAKVVTQAGLAGTE